MLDGVKCKHSEVKDEIEVFGNDIEKVSLSGKQRFVCVIETPLLQQNLNKLYY